VASGEEAAAFLAPRGSRSSAQCRVTVSKSYTNAARAPRSSSIGKLTQNRLCVARALLSARTTVRALRVKSMVIFLHRAAGKLITILSADSAHSLQPTLLGLQNLTVSLSGSGLTSGFFSPFLPNLSQLTERQIISVTAK